MFFVCSAGAGAGAGYSVDLPIGGLKFPVVSSNDMDGTTHPIMMMPSMMMMMPSTAQPRESSSEPPSASTAASTSTKVGLIDWHEIDGHVSLAASRYHHIDDHPLC